ncbi:MAG TPA: dTDP-4-dehydrorhamnose 3,5-epimerase [Flavobacteriia bacterium]|jgi:dTDP-4-dehydrorhamnose 3,5-epimerase|nr:dTDP-4-dehydrorhamnose 3,5-epimerase [Flavobacteriia bacterium]
MKFHKTTIEDCYLIDSKVFRDERGKFIKPFNYIEFKRNGIEFIIKEEYFTISKMNVLRGMHFQNPPKAVAKLIACLEGEVMDVVIDLRKKSKTYLKVFSTTLREDGYKMLFVPEGLAHGFVARSEKAMMLYMCSEVYSPENDNGIKWDSIEIDWNITNPIVSQRDNSLMPLNQFKTPF